MSNPITLGGLAGYLRGSDLHHYAALVRSAAAVVEAARHIRLDFDGPHQLPYIRGLAKVNEALNAHDAISKGETP